MLGYGPRGEDDPLGGGIYWHEQERRVTSVASTSQTLLAVLRLFQVTHRPEYMDDALRLYAWINRNLQAPDGLFLDGPGLDGTTGTVRWSYYSATMIRANLLLYQLKGDRGYLAEAERIAAAAETQWVDEKTGALKDPMRYSEWLWEAFLDLYRQDHRARWRQVARRALVFLHDHVQDPQGHYGDNWSAEQPDSLENFRLVNQATVARMDLRGQGLRAER